MTEYEFSHIACSLLQLGTKSLPIPSTSNLRNREYFDGLDSRALAAFDNRPPFNSTLHIGSDTFFNVPTAQSLAVSQISEKLEK